MIKWEGTTALMNTLKKAEAKFPQARNQFLMQEAELLTGRVKKLTPVDTGRLRGAWGRTEPEGDSIEVYNNVEYAQYVEFGHRTRGGGSFVEGQFFLRDAVDESREHFITDSKKILDNIFKG